MKEKPYPVAEVEQLDRLEEFPNTCKTREELRELSEQFYKYTVQLVEMLAMSVPAVAKLRRLLDSLPREALPDILTSISRTSNKEKLQILDAVSLEERFKMTIPLLVRQIEGLKLLQKTRKHKQDDDKRVIAIRPREGLHTSQVLQWTKMRMKITVTLSCWRKRYGHPACQNRPTKSVSKR